MRLAVVVFLTVVLAGCAAPEVLIPKPPTPPRGVDFSGLWELRADPGAERRRLDDAIRRTDGFDGETVLRQIQRPGRDPVVVQQRETGGLVHVFLQHGQQLKVTQTAGALFISFDRAVVEEFRFGEHREVRVGPVVAQRVSGWDGEAYVVETLDENRMKLTERFELVDRDRLRRTIVLRGKDQKSVTVVQQFERVG